MALSPAYLNAIGAALGDPFAAGAAAAGIDPAPVAPPPVSMDQVNASNVSLAPVPALTQGGTFATGLPAPPAPEPALAPPATTTAPRPGPPPMPMPTADGASQDAGPLLLQIGGGGVTPAHEVDMRGPSLRMQQGVANQALESAVNVNRENTTGQSQDEYATYLEQERGARAREAAAQQSVAEREEEMSMRLADFDASVKNLSKMTVDRDRWFASRSTPQKVAAFIELGLAGFRGAPSMVMKRIDDDVKAQEFAYQVARDTVDASKTAFGMAMQKYQNADAARAMVRAAALDSAQAQTAQLGALAKDTAAANHANTMLAALEDQKVQQIQQGIRFMPAAMGQERYLDKSTGMVLTKEQALKRLDTLEGRNFDERKILLNIGGDLAKEGAKAGQRTSDEARGISTQLQQAGVPQARAAAELALAALGKSPGGAGEATARWALGGGDVANKLMSDDANAREQAYWAFANASMKAMMGNVTESEMKRAQKQLGSASDPESRRRAIASTLEVLNAVERNAKAGASPAAQAEFDARRDRANAPNDAWKDSFTAHGGKK